MIKKSLLYFYALLSCIILITSCKRPKPEQEKSNHDDKLSGEWIEVSPEDQRRLMFMDDGKFAMFIGEEKNYTIKISGNYTIKGDSLKAQATEQLERQDDKPMLKTELNNILFEGGTYKFKDGQLIINYITYPADAPVETILTLKRVLPPG